MTKKTTKAHTRRRTPKVNRADSRTASPACQSCAAVELRLNTLITWMAGSANSPISVDEALRLLNEVGVQ